jgi:periplasmic protein TonB
MRKYTFLVSLVAHLGVVVAVVLTTLVVTHTLPRVPPMFEFVLVRAEMPPTPPAPPQPRASQPAPERLSEIPFEAPDTVRPESDAPRMVDDTPTPGIGADLGGGIPGGTGQHAVEPPPLPAPAPRLVVPVRVGGVVVAPNKVHHVPPVYPRIALAARKQGVVILEAVIAEDGTVRELRVLRSEPLLDQAAVDAVKQWRFTPTLLNGQPTPVIMTVTVAFNVN